MNTYTDSVCVCLSAYVIGKVTDYKHILDQNASGKEGR